MSTVCIVTRTKNREILLARALDDVLRQTWTDWVHVIVNDGGDPTRVDELVAARAGRYGGRVIVIHNPVSVGMEAASNIGVRSCASDWIVIHDDDDTWHPTYLQRMLDEMSRLPAALWGGVACWSEVVHEKIEGTKVVEVGRSLFNGWMKRVTLLRMAVSNTLPPISFLFRRQVWEELGGFHEGLPVLGDWEFHLRFLELYRVKLVTEPLAYYHHRVSAEGTEYANTVNASNSRHEEFYDLLVDDWIREGMADNRLARAELVMLSKLWDSLGRAEQASVDAHAQVVNLRTTLSNIPVLGRIARWASRRR